MKLLYIANARIPTQKAHGIAIMRACQALVRAGVEVTLVAARRINPLPRDARAFYGITESFQLIRLPVIDLVYMRFLSNRTAFAVKVATFYVSLFIWMLFRSRSYVIYTRDAGVLALSYLGFSVFFECHVVPAKTGRFFRLLRRAQGIVVISDAIRTDLIAGGIPEANITVQPSGVDLSTFDIDISKADTRARLGLSHDARLIVYTGNFTTFGEDKGIADVLASLLHLDPRIEFVAVGGGDDDCKQYGEMAHQLGVGARTHIIGYRTQHDLALYQRAADILLMPFPDTPHYRSRMSPVKMFEYMASKRPIIASDLPTIRTVLEDDMAVFVPPGDPEAIAKAVESILADPEHAERLATAAYERVTARYSWDQRTRAVLRFMEEHV